MPLSLLALDLGAESGRAILGQFDGEKLQLVETHRFANRPAQLPDGLHWDILGLWNEVLHGIGLSAARSSSGLDGIGLDTWGVDFALLDARDGLISNPYHYRDGRTDGLMARAFASVPRPEIFRQTGAQFLQINSLYQLLSMVVNQSPALSSARTFLMIPDLLNFWLSDRKVCEFSNATTTQCFDPARRDWARPLLRDLAIPTDIFPEIVPPGTVLGPLSARVAEATAAGLVPVIAPACHDTGSAVAAVPANTADHAWISSGTWSIVGVNVPEPVVDERALAYNLTNEGGVRGDYRLSKNVMGLWLIQECRRTWAAEGHAYDYEALTQLAATAPPLRSVIDPDADVFLKPGDMPGRIRDYCRRTGQPVPEDAAQVVRCALESIALKYRWVVERLEEIVGRRLGTIHIVGGGTRNELLSQWTADCLGREVITGPVEATAVGNLLAQAVALGRLGSWDDAQEVVRASFAVKTVSPRQTGDKWNDAYQRLLALMAAEAG